MQHGSDQNSFRSTPVIERYGERVKSKGTTNGGEEILCF